MVSANYAQVREMSSETSAALTAPFIHDIFLAIRGGEGYQTIWQRTG